MKQVNLGGEWFPIDPSRMAQILHCLSSCLPMHLYVPHTLIRGDGETCTVMLDGRTVEYGYPELLDALQVQQ